MQRFTLLCVLSAALALAFAGVARADSDGTTCQVRPYLCVDPVDSIGEYANQYTGHDEPSLIYGSDRKGTAGQDLTYLIRLPTNPSRPPQQDGLGTTWDFQLRATFWLGMALCDTQSAPEYRDTCRPNSDANARFTSLDPGSPHYIGKAPGNAYMELQFYEPGWVNQFDGFGCSATQWCANFTIDSRTLDQNTGIENTDACDAYVLGGPEPINWAYVTKNGQSQAPANPIGASTDPRALKADPRKALFMNSGDLIRVHEHDTPAGERVDITDLTTHQHGSMTASKANGFGHLMYTPNSDTCHEEPYAFHPEFSKAGTRGSTWAAHTYNVAFSDEIGHFEYCNAIEGGAKAGACSVPGAGESELDVDDQGCLDGSQFPGAVPIIGCLLDDGDFDGVSYQRNTWPGGLAGNQANVPTPVQFRTPKSFGKPLESIAFENDMPRIEVGEPGNPSPPCDRNTGDHCVNPPPGAEFYPIYTAAHTSLGCMWQQGGTHLPGTFRTFGGNSATEYGDLLQVGYPGPGFQPFFRYNDFRRDYGRNPCT